MKNVDAYKAEGFEGFISIKNLIKSKASEIPTNQGIFIVIRQIVEEPNFLNQSLACGYRKMNPTVSIEKLIEKWVDNTITLFIGFSGSSTKPPGLQKYIRQYVEFGSGKNINHWKGRYIWQLSDAYDSLIAWKVTGSDPKNQSEKLITIFKERHGKMPYANIL